MSDLNQHYRALLGLDEAWNINSVDLDLEANQVFLAELLS
jgi:hypothetical protein